MIGSLVSIFPAIQYSPLYTKKFEREKFLVLLSSSGDFSSKMIIPSYLQDDFNRWLKALSNTKQFNTIHSKPFVLEIFSDASSTDWEAVRGDQQTHGWWSPGDSHLHINVLELKAAFYALRCFAGNFKDSNILLCIATPRQSPT